MAKRRMFNTSFIFTDKFADLSPFAVKLYLSLMGSADDDGFVSGPKSITRYCNCSNEDLDLLVREGLIYIFDSGIAVIRHWFLHNHIRKDRRTDTIFREEKGRLQLLNNVYEWQIFEEGTRNEMPLSTTTEEDPSNDLTEDAYIEEIREEEDQPIGTAEEGPEEEMKLIRYRGRDNHAEEIDFPCYFDDSTIQKLFKDFIRQRRERGYTDIEARIQLFVVQLMPLTREEKIATLLDALWYDRDEFCIQNVTGGEERE